MSTLVHADADSRGPESGAPSGSPKSEALQALYWRSEILRVVYWLRGEGLGDFVDPGLLEEYLGVDASFGLTFLDRLVDEGYLTREGDWFSLTALGLAEGEEEYATAFSDLVRPAYGACSPECWCEMSSAEAEACSHQLAERQVSERQRQDGGPR